MEVRVTLSVTTLAAVGIFCLGLFVGYLAWYFITRLRSYGVAALAGIVAVVGSSVIITFIQADPLGQSIRWWYPIGLVAGWGLFTLGSRRQQGP